MIRRAACTGAALIALAACGQSGPMGPDRNRSPEIRTLTVTPGVIPLGGSATVRVEASDPDGDAIFYRFEATAGSITADPAQAGSATYRNDGVARGSDSIRVIVTDSNNASTSGVASVTLQGNRAPTVSLGTPIAEGACHPRCTLTVEATAQDADGDALEYTWSGCASGHGPTSRCSLDIPGTYTASVLVEDGRGGVASATVTLEGTNRAPSVTGGRKYSGTGLFRFQVENDDPDGDTMVCGWWGDCQCAGSIQSYNLTCTMPVDLTSCFERFACTDPFGETGETRFEIAR